MNAGSEHSASEWLAIVGVGADGAGGLTERARAAIAAAQCVFGSRRQLELVRELIRGETRAWPSVLSDGIAELLARRGRATCVLASGDPFWFGIGATLAPHLSPGEFNCHPAPSSMSLAAARLGWPLQDTDVVSLHGRELSNVVRYLQPGRRVLALSWDRTTPAALAALLCARGFGPSRMHVLEALGSAQERVRSSDARAFELADIAELNLIAIEVAAGAHAAIAPLRASLPDDAFEHDGQLTKQDVRAITLSALAPRAGARLWDVGAGAGSIAIEWMLAHPSCRAIAIERDGDRCARIRRNATALGVPGLQVVHAEAPSGLRELATPDAVFIGGPVADAAAFELCFAALRSGGRLVANAVSLPAQAALLERHARRRTARRSDNAAARARGDAMAHREAVIAAGFGCRRACTQQGVLAALAAALEHAGRTLDEVAALYAPEARRDAPALRAAALALGKPLEFVGHDQLARQAQRALTRSERVHARLGLPSIAETAALAGAARICADSAVHLLGPRQVAGAATCALAIAGAAPAFVGGHRPEPG
jgi:precorrin-6Y C5,15-methyltransferase (decarboxylating)